MPTYFDQREGREKPLPNCERVGLRWDARTQRCERMGLGFAAEWDGDYFYDEFGNYWQSDWFDGGDWDAFTGQGGGSPFDYYQGLDYGYWIGEDGTLYTLNPDDADYGSQFNAPGGGAESGGLFDSFFDWINSQDWSFGVPEYGPAGPDGSNPNLPGYCPGGQYHPLNDPFACVPFPPADPAARKQATAQQKAQQAAMNAAKKAQQQQDRTCPPDPQRRPVWRNPQTGQCELVPQCPSGSRFDATTRRCLTPAQTTAVFGSGNNWLLWLLVGGGALLLLSKGNSGNTSGGRRR